MKRKDILVIIVNIIQEIILLKAKGVVMVLYGVVLRRQELISNL